MHSYRPANARQRFLLATDIDGTLLGDNAGEEAFRLFVSNYPDSLWFAAMTGRTRRSVEDLVATGRLPQPHYIVGSVGTDLTDCHDPANLMGTRWRERVSPQWDVESIYSIGEGDGVVRQVFSEAQPPFHAAFMWDGRDESLDAFRTRMAAAQECRIIASHRRYIDVLPTGVGKGDAVTFLQSELSVDRDRVVVAGDSGNDCELFEAGFPGVVVANAQEEILACIREPFHYRSGLPGARGVLDGLEHFGLVTRAAE